MKRIKLTVFPLFTGLCLFCQPVSAFQLVHLKVKAKPKEVQHKPLVMKSDSAAINLRHFNTGKLHQYTTSPDFKYDKNNAPGESLWAMIWHWIYEHLFRGLFESDGSGDFFYYFFLAVGVVLLIYVLLKVSGIDVVQVLKGKSQSVPVPYSESLENILEIDFDSELEKAISTKNFRLAVRLLYLNSLKQLNDRGLISWQIEKTNATYISEITEDSKRLSFGSLTMQFEYVWYGEFFVDARSFDSIQSSFQTFRKGL